MYAIPQAVQEDLLRRYSSIGPRLDRLYKVVFGGTYWSDLSEVGYPQVASLLQNVHQRRNDFTHGKPAAIDDRLVEDLIISLRDEHEAWIAVYNKRATRIQQ